MAESEEENRRMRDQLSELRQAARAPVSVSLLKRKTQDSPIGASTIPKKVQKRSRAVKQARAHSAPVTRTLRKKSKDLGYVRYD